MVLASMMMVAAAVAAPPAHAGIQVAAPKPNVSEIFFTRQASVPYRLSGVTPGVRFQCRFGPIRGLGHLLLHQRAWRSCPTRGSWRVEREGAYFMQIRVMRSGKWDQPRRVLWAERDTTPPRRGLRYHPEGIQNQISLSQCLAEDTGYRIDPHEEIKLKFCLYEFGSDNHGIAWSRAGIERASLDSAGTCGTFSEVGVLFHHVRPGQTGWLEGQEQPTRSFCWRYSYAARDHAGNSTSYTLAPIVISAAT